jgi:hypothetical protein
VHRTELDWSRLLAAESGLAEAEVDARPPASAWGASRADAIDRAVWAWIENPGPRAADLPGLRLGHAGPLMARGEDDAVEVWVDSELAVMHGLWRASRVQGDEALRKRLFDAVCWHVEHTGTENATHRPWAAHIFLLEGSLEARLFAEGQVHACRADGGPDPCSRWILADAARELGLAARSGRP